MVPTRSLLYVGIAVMMAIFLFIQLGGPLLKRPFGPQDDVAGALSQVERAVSRGDWATARQAFDRSVGAWRRVVPRIQFSEEKDTITLFSHTLAQLGANVATQNRDLAAMQLATLKVLWENLGR